MPKIKFDIWIEDSITKIKLDSVKNLTTTLPVFMKNKKDKENSKILAKNLVKTFNKINKMLN